MQPHGRQPLLHHPMQLPDQACAHGCAPISDGVEGSDTQAWIQQPQSWKPIQVAWVAQLRNRQAWRSWMSSSLSGPGGDPACKSLGFKPPLLEHFALGEGKAKELELGCMIQNINVQTRACKDKLSKRKGVKQEDPRGELSNMSFQQQQQQQRRKAA